VKRATDWPRYMKTRKLAGGRISYYWYAHERDIAEGFAIPGEALGEHFIPAAERARFLNAHLDAWRDGQSVPVEKQASERVGSIAWWHAQYFAHEAFTRLSPRSQDDYREVLTAIGDLTTTLKNEETAQPVRLKHLHVSTLTPAAVDKIYSRLRKGGRVTRQADLAIDVARRAWKVVGRLHPGVFLVPMPGADGATIPMSINPFHGVIRAKYERDTAIPATRAQALHFAAAATAAGHPALGLAALICFELHQRPEDVREGRICWTDYRPEDHPTKVRVFHHKTGKREWKPLETFIRSQDRKKVERRLLYPELEAAIAALPKLGVALMMFEPQRGPKLADGRRVARLYSESHAQHLVQRIRKDAGLPKHFTLEACRHGGMTELGDAELTEQEVMALSKHATPQAARLYVKRNERQELSAATKRRDFVEGKRTNRG